MSNPARFVDDDVTIIVLANLSSAELKALTQALAATVFDLPYEKPFAREKDGDTREIDVNWSGHRQYAPRIS